MQMRRMHHPAKAPIVLSIVLTFAVMVAWVGVTSALYDWALHRWMSTWATSPLFAFWIPFGGGTCLVWCLGSAFSGRISARFSGGSRAPVLAAVFTQVALSLWWTRDFWLYGVFTTSVRPALWVPNYLWAAVVLIGMPASVILGARWERTTRMAH